MSDPIREKIIDEYMEMWKSAEAEREKLAQKLFHVLAALIEIEMNLEHSPSCHLFLYNKCTCGTANIASALRAAIAKANHD